MREFQTLYTDEVARRGQKAHSSRMLRDRRDESCNGAIGRAYRREQVAGRQRWVVIGEYCDGCETFWPTSALPEKRRYEQIAASPKQQAARDQLARDGYDEDDLPAYL